MQIHPVLEILRFFDKHGLAATRDAFGVSRRTLYRWKAALKAQGGNPAALAAQSCAPRKRRVPKTDPRLVSEIRRLRTLHPTKVKAQALEVLACSTRERSRLRHAPLHRHLHRSSFTLCFCRSRSSFWSWLETRA